MRSPKIAPAISFLLDAVIEDRNIFFFLRSVLCILSKDKISICCPGECILCRSSWQAEIFSSFLNDFLFLFSSPPLRSFYPATPHRKPLPSYHNVNSYEILGLIPEFGPASSYNIRQFYSNRDHFPSGNTVSQHNIFYCQAKQFFNPSLGDHISLFKTYLVKHINSVLSLLMADRRTLTPRHSPALGGPPHLLGVQLCFRRFFPKFEALL